MRLAPIAITLVVAFALTALSHGAAHDGPNFSPTELARLARLERAGGCGPQEAARIQQAKQALVSRILEHLEPSLLQLGDSSRFDPMEGMEEPEPGKKCMVVFNTWMGRCAMPPR